jgi:hypothetical protein
MLLCICWPVGVELAKRATTDAPLDRNDRLRRGMPSGPWHPFSLNWQIEVVSFFSRSTLDLMGVHMLVLKYDDRSRKQSRTNTNLVRRVYITL